MPGHPGYGLVSSFGYNPTNTKFSIKSYEKTVFGSVKFGNRGPVKFVLLLRIIDGLFVKSAVLFLLRL